MEEGYVPESILWRAERNRRLAGPVRVYRQAQDPEARRKAMRELATEYALLNASGKDAECNLTAGESDALLGILSGQGYREEPRIDPAAELQARKDASAAIFAEESERWKTRR